MTADLDEERDFLLRSLRDLEAERDAGDIEEADYIELRDDYTARAAEVLRLLGNTGRDPTPPAQKSSRGWRKRVIGAVLVVVIAGLAAWGVASSAGQRLPGQSVSGNITPTADPRLAKARDLIGQQKILDAVKLYDQILKDDPNQPEALTYRGWLVRLAGLPDDGLKYLDRAVAADPAYPDARVFRGIIQLRDKNQPAAAVTDFCAFMANNPPQQMVALVQQPLDEALKATGKTACP
jgi:tetratricopeptide (TPR) repeat protein